MSVELGTMPRHQGSCDDTRRSALTAAPQPDDTTVKGVRDLQDSRTKKVARKAER